jgi:hypothetical protein
VGPLHRWIERRNETTWRAADDDAVTSANMFVRLAIGQQDERPTLEMSGEISHGPE